MLFKFKLVLRPTQIDKANVHQASLYHGWLMQQIPKELSRQMHQEQHPLFSQYLIKDKASIEWHIHTWNNQLGLELKKIFAINNSIYLEHIQLELKIEECQVTTQEEADLISHYAFSQDTKKYLTIEFLTPTSFKSQGRYLNYPTPRFIIQSALNRVDQNIDAVAFFDKETFAELLASCYINRYNLHSTYFSLEGTKINGFIGKVELACNGPKQLQSFLKLLFKLTEYTGLGAKTALGMGAIKVSDNYFYRKESLT